MNDLPEFPCCWMTANLLRLQGERAAQDLRSGPFDSFRAGYAVLPDRIEKPQGLP